jgi:antitoxin VapB
MDCDDAIIRKEGKRLILEPLKKKGLLTILEGLETLDETFPDVDKNLLPLDNIEL